MILKSTLTMLLLSLSVVAVNAANLVTNGGFETGNFTAWTLGGTGLNGGPIFDPIDGLYDTNPAVGVGTGSAGVYPPHSGNDYSYFAAGGANTYITLSQIIATTANQAYTVTFWLANDTTPDVAHGYLNYVTGSFGSNSMTYNNIAGTTNASTYLLYTFYGVATSPSTTLSLTFDNYAGEFDVDDIMVNAGTPEPASLLLVGPAIGALYFVRRRRRA